MAGHDLVIDVGVWEAAAEVREDGALSAVQLDADPRSLQVREGLRGVRPLTDKDRAGIGKIIDEQILGGGRSRSAPPRSSPDTVQSRCAANSSWRVRSGRPASNSRRPRTAGCAARCP